MSGGVSWRPLQARDLDAVQRLVNAEGWAFTKDELARLLHLGGGVVAEADGRLVGALTLVVHASQAWIGNVVVDPDARGRGIGELLVEGALARAKDERVETVGLYSVMPAVTLYERAGFERAGRVASFATTLAADRARPARDPSVRPMRRDDLRALVALDARAAGTERARQLEVLHAAFPDHAFVLEREGTLDGYVIAKPSTSGSEIGPLVTRAPEDADAIAALVDAALGTLPAGGVEAGAHLENAAARHVLVARGFEESFPGLTMYHGGVARVDGRLTALVAGMEKG